MKFKVSSGLNIAASSWGLESDPLVVLLHGGGQTRHAWGETGKKLSESRFHVLALDLRGHGESGEAPLGLGVREKEDIYGAIKFLSNEKDINSLSFTIFPVTFLIDVR